ncbi:hypothetical protein AB6878_17065 [Carnobacterium maltaromaticum]|uniref:hypothetical protein n=1 Tax=Carnobacterium maltaromaticum TaxID=2751 RepID=UPI0039BE7F0A
MALIDRPAKDTPKVNDSADTNREILPKKVKLSASERKNVKVSPETLEIIKTLSLMQSVKHYEFIDTAINFYIEEKLTDREKRMLKNIIN